MSRRRHVLQIEHFGKIRKTSGPKWAGGPFNPDVGLSRNVFPPQFVIPTGADQCDSSDLRSGGTCCTWCLRRPPQLRVPHPLRFSTGGRDAVRSAHDRPGGQEPRCRQAGGPSFEFRALAKPWVAHPCAFCKGGPIPALATKAFESRYATRRIFISVGH